MVHTHAGEEIPETATLPQGRAFVLPGKHGGLDPERLPAEKQRRGNLEAFMSASQEALLGRRRS